MEAADSIIVTGARAKRADFSATMAAVMAAEEQLGDLKLYRVPEPVNVNAKGQKQVAFLDKRGVKGQLLYVAQCDPWDEFDDDKDFEPYQQAEMLLATKNDEANGLGSAMPMGQLTLFETGEAGQLLVATPDLRDYAKGQDIELAMGESAQVFFACERVGERKPENDKGKPRWVTMKSLVTNANPGSVKVRLNLGYAPDWKVSGLKGTRLKDGNTIYEFEVPANGRREISFRMKPAG